MSAFTLYSDRLAAMPSRPGGFFSDDPPPDRDGDLGGAAALFLDLADLDPDDQTARLNAIPETALREEVAALLAADAAAERVLHRLDRLAPVDAHGQRLGPYRILDEVGRGGMGVVYRAEDTRIGRTVALKVLPAPLGADLEARARLVAEARAAGALDHAHVGTLYDIAETPDGRLYLVLAYYEGETLKARLGRGPLTSSEAERIVREMASGLAAAHAAGIVHRDVKPSNVLLTPSGVKLLDFGIAKGLGDDLTRTGATLGTAAYMSPEQTRGEPVDARADVWALGVVLYEMLTGERPFRGRGEALVHAIRHDAPAPLPSSAPPGLKRVVERALAKDPDGRYPDAAALLADLDTGPGRSFRSRRWGVGAGLAAVLFFAALWALSRNEAIPDEAFVIAVAPFSAVGDGAEEEAGVMQALVFREVEAVLGREPDVRLLDLGGEAPTTGEEARQVGEDEGAHLVVWGEVVVLRDEVEIRPQVTRARMVDGVLAPPDHAAGGTGAVTTSLTAEDQLALRRTKAAEVGDLALLIAAHYYATRGEYDRALGLYDRVRQSSVESEGAAAFVLFMKGEYEAAAERYERATELGTPGGLFWFGYAATLLYTGRVGEAEGRLRRGLEQQPNDPLLKGALAWAVSLQGKGDEVAQLVAEAGELEPRTQAERLGYGWLMFMGGHLDRSEAAFQALIDHAWSNVEQGYGYQGLSIVYLSQGRFQAGVRAARAAVEADSTDEESYRILARSYLSLVQYAEAEAAYARFMALSDLLEAPLMLAFVRAMQDDPDAVAPIRARVDTLTGDGYLKPIFRLVVGQATEAEVLAAAARPDSVWGGPWTWQAHFFLGHLYEAGLGSVPRDTTRALAHYRRAAELGIDPTPVTDPMMAIARVEGDPLRHAAPRETPAHPDG